MNVKLFLKENFVLLIGLILPVLLMAGFLAVSTLPGLFGAPPKYDMIFASTAYGDDVTSDTVVADTGQDIAPHPPVSVKLVVGKDGVLHAHYKRRSKDDVVREWLKLYIYEAKTGKVRPLPFPVPEDAVTIKTTRDDIVQATRDYHIDPGAVAPDGYRLTYGGGSNVGLLGDLFGHNYSSHYYSYPSLEKGGSKKMLIAADDRQFDLYDSPRLVGWVIGHQNQ